MNDPLARYVAYLEGFDDASLEALPEYIAATVHFRDPFNDVHGLAAMETIFRDMLAQVGGLRFQVSAWGWCDYPLDQRRAFLIWRLSGVLHKLDGKAWSVDGTSALVFDESDRIIVHHDYWDAASGLYERLPLLGRLLKRLRRRLAN